jgi:hypothetical protein
LILATCSVRASSLGRIAPDTVEEPMVSSILARRPNAVACEEASADVPRPASRASISSSAASTLASRAVEAFSRSSILSVLSATVEARSAVAA